MPNPYLGDDMSVVEQPRLGMYMHRQHPGIEHDIVGWKECSEAARKAGPHPLPSQFRKFDENGHQERIWRVSHFGPCPECQRVGEPNYLTRYEGFDHLNFVYIHGLPLGLDSNTEAMLYLSGIAWATDLEAPQRWLARVHHYEMVKNLPKSVQESWDYANKLFRGMPELADLSPFERLVEYERLAWED
jgi:hypothetical protein